MPFSFNLPEASELPPGATLQGADFTYLEGKPTAMLLFVINKHHISVFVSQFGKLPRLSASSGRSGFHVEEASKGGLELLAISDVNQSNLKALVLALVNAQ